MHKVFKYCNKIRVKGVILILLRVLKINPFPMSFKKLFLVIPLCLIMVLPVYADGTEATYTAEVFFEAAYEEDLANGNDAGFSATYMVSVDEEDDVYWEKDDGCKFLLMVTDVDPLSSDDYEILYEWEYCGSDTDSELLNDNEEADQGISVGGKDFLENEGEFWTYFEPLNTNTDDLYIPAVSVSFVIDFDELDEPFSDVDGHWSENYINSLATLEDLGGYSDGTFRPDNEISRAEILKVALNALSDPKYGTCEAFDFDQDFDDRSFTDVYPSHWAYDYVELAASMDIISGYEDETFRPNDTVTRAEALSILWRTYMVCDYNYLDSWYGDYYYEQYLDEGVDFAADLDLEFTDVSENWQRFFVYLSYEHGMVEGYEDEHTGELEFRPNNTITRAEVSKLAWQLRVNPHDPEPF